jgi:cell division protein FtsA
VRTDPFIVGLDIGTTKIAAVIAEYGETGMLEIVGVGVAPSYGLRRGVVINIESTLKSVHAAVEAAEQMAGFEVQQIVVGIAGGHIEGINSRGVVKVTGRGREITQHDVDRVIEAARAVSIPMDREVLHVIPQEYIVDEQDGIKDPLDMIGVRLEAEVHIITGSVTSAQNLVKCVNRAGFRVESFVLDSLASARAVLSRDEMELGVLALDLGGGTTDVLVYLEGAPYFTSVVPVGGAQVTSDLSIMLKTPMESAERIKREAGCCYLDRKSVV